MKKVNILFLVAITGLFVACTTTTKDRDPASGDSAKPTKSFNWHDRFIPDRR